MRITFICVTPEQTGGQRVIAIYAAKLAAKGHKVTLVCAPPKSSTFLQRIKTLIKKRRWIGRKPIALNYFGSLPSEVEIRLVHHPIPIVNSDVPDSDIVIGTWWETTEWVTQFGPEKGLKVFFVQHHETFDYLPLDRVRAAYRLPFKKIVVSSWLANIMREVYGETDPILVPNSVDSTLFHAPPREKNQNPKVGFLFSISHWKGCDLIIQAIEKARIKIPNLAAVAFGTQKNVDTYLPTFVEYLYSPPQENIRSIYSQCDGWLFGSRVEGFGLPILEAMACRTPVIGTPAGAAPELISKGGGYLVEPEDPDSMAAAIVKLCSLDPNEWKTLSNAAYATTTSYNWNDATELFEKALMKILKDRGTSPFFTPPPAR